jgi:hypothetical protein
MSVQFGRTRAAVQLRKGAGEAFETATTLSASTPLKILSQEGDWFQVQLLDPAGFLNRLLGQRGYIPVSAIAIVEPAEDILPNLPAEVKPQTVLDWMETAERPPWFSEEHWEMLVPEDRQNIIFDLQNAVNEHLDEIRNWYENAVSMGREDEVVMGEWLAIQREGIDMWPVRPHYVYQDPDQESEILVAVNDDEILTWTGPVHQAPGGRSWYRVNIHKFGRLYDGWFRGDLLEKYLPSTPENDPTKPENAARVFDLSTPLLTIPDDPEIQDAENDPAVTGAQYIMLTALGINRRHYNLCGELCVASLGGMNIIPFLQQWRGSYHRAEEILRNNLPTGITDLRSMLDVFGLESEMFQHGHSNPFSNSPRNMQERLHDGEMLIAGVSIKVNGDLHPDGTIQHWVVLEDVLPVANSGWYRLYNPFPNEEEVYNFDLFKAALGSFGIGLWVKVTE